VLRLPRFQLIISGILIALALLGVSAVLVANIPALLMFLGKRPDLTGRTELWSQVITAIGKHPWCGYGVHSFWKGMYGPSASVIEALGWDVPHAHNGILDLLLDVGVIGLVFFVLAFISATWGAIRNYRETRDDKNLWPLLLLAMFAAGNLTESTILNQSLFWTLFMSSTYRISRRGRVQDVLVTERAGTMIPIPAIAQARGANR
jgi:O-antigen ligase